MTAPEAVNEQARTTSMDHYARHEQSMHEEAPVPTSVRPTDTPREAETLTATASYTMNDSRHTNAAAAEAANYTATASRPMNDHRPPIAAMSDHRPETERHGTRGAMSDHRPEMSDRRAMGWLV